MRMTRLALAASAALVVTGLSVPSLAANGHTNSDGCIESVPETPGGDPVEICYTLFKPGSASAASPVPMVLHSHGWGGSRTSAAGSFGTWLDKDFGVLSFDQRGFGASGGKAHVENPDFEGQDVIGLVDLIAELDWVAKEQGPTETVEQTRSPGKSAGKGKGKKNGHTSPVTRPVFPSDPVLGAIGGSYGGGYQFVGAFTELRDFGVTRFDSLAPEITWFDLKESLAPDEVARSTWLTALTAAGAEALPEHVVAGYAYGAGTGLWPGKGNPVTDLDAFFEKNGPAWHVRQGTQLDIPVLLGQGTPDNLFNLNQGLKNFEQAITGTARAQSIFVGYNKGHVLPNALPLAYAGSGDPCSRKLGGGDFGLLAQKFFQENLQGLDQDLRGHGRYHVATTADDCATVDSVTGNAQVRLGTVPTTTAAGGPVAYELREGPLRIVGQPTVSAEVTSVGVHNRAFFALSVGTTPLDARVVANNVMPLNEPLPVNGEARSFELPAVAVDVPAGQKLFLTVSPVSDMFVAHGSRTPGALVLESTVVHLPVR
jgi:ABC-2 type transport system ATP-binding protein